MGGGRATGFTIVYACAVACAVAFVAGAAFRWGHDGLTFAPPSAEGPVTIRSVLELIYYVTNPVVVVVGGLALATARRQFKEAENTRLAGVYSSIVAELNGKEMTESRLSLGALHAAFQGTGRPPETFSDYVHEQINPLRADPEGLKAYHGYIKIIFFMENVGLLIRRSYVDAVDVSLLMGSAMRFTAAAFRTHIEFRRVEANNPLMFEHLLEGVAIIDRVECLRDENRIALKTAADF